MKNYLKLIKLLKNQKRLFFVASATMVVASFFEVFQFSMLVPMIDIIFTGKKIIPPKQMPSFAMDVINRLNSMSPEHLLPLFGFAAIGLLLLKNSLVFCYQYLMGDVSQRLMRDVRFRLYERIQTLSLDYFSQKKTGELVARITNDVGLIDNALSYGLTDLVRQSFTIVFLIGGAFLIDPQAAVILFILFPIIGVPMAQIGRRLRKISKTTQEKFAHLNIHLLETIAGAKLVKAFATERYEIDRFGRANHDLYKLRMKSIKRLIVIPPVTEIIGGFFIVGIIFWFGKRLMGQEMSFGIFVMFIACIVSVISPIKKLGNVNALTQQALAANDRIYEVLEQKPTVHERENPVILNELKNSIQLQNVDFRYRSDDKLILQNISLEIKKGELVAFVGPTGTGKTTLVNLIPRFYDPMKGRITFDGVDIKDVSFSSLRRQFGIVTQETILFHDTVRANIAYGNPDATIEQVQAVAKKAFAHQFIEKMTSGYDTIIGDQGVRLSGGEKQRISIARAILRDPPILILDEATSQLDSESEKFVQEALDELMKGRTVIAIAHRLSTILRADKIVVLDKGKIVGLDTHEKLLKTCPLYEKLYKMQFQFEA